MQTWLISYHWSPRLLPLCAVGLLVLRRVRFKNRSVVQLILMIAALLFASLVVDILHHTGYGSTVGQLLPLAGVAVSFVDWLKERRAAAEAAGDSADE